MAAEGTGVKKKGRPSKRDKAKKAKDAVIALDRWLEKNTYTYPEETTEHGSSTGTFTSSAAPKTTHTLISHPPSGSRAIYAVEKTRLLNVLDPPSGDPVAIPSDSDVASGSTGDMSHPLALSAHVMDPNKRLFVSDAQGPLEREALARANEAVLARLKKIDEMAAERGP